MDEMGNPVVWEACITMNNNWGYCAADKNFKPAEMIMHKLVECVSKGGNLLLNVGPDAQGLYPAGIACEILPEHRPLDAAATATPSTAAAAAICRSTENGRITRCGKTLYYHIYGKLAIGGIPLAGHAPRGGRDDPPRSATGAEVQIPWTAGSPPTTRTRSLAHLGPSPPAADPVDTVLEVTLKA